MIRVCLLALLLVGCGDRAASENEAIAAANAYLAAWPAPIFSPEHHIVLEAIDMGDRWRISYGFRPGEGGTGGGIIAVVNKRSGEVVHAEMTQ